MEDLDIQLKSKLKWVNRVTISENGYILPFAGRFGN